MNKPCTIEVRRVYHRRDAEYGEWTVTRDTFEPKRPPWRFRSVRQAHERLVDALYQHVDYLSRAFYEVQLRFADGSTRRVRESAVDHAVQLAKWEQQDNSIGACLRRGETVVV